MLLFPQRPVETLKALLLPSLLPAPYHCHSLHISFTLLTLSSLTSSPLFCLPLFLFLLTLFLLPCSLICLFLLSGVCTMHINYSEAVSRFLLAYPIRAGLRTNGLLLYLLPAPTHSRDSGGGGDGERRG